MKAHDYFTVTTTGGMLLRVCRRCGGTDFLERVVIHDDKGHETGKDEFDWVPVHQRDVKGGSTVTPRECVGESSQPSSSSTSDDKVVSDRLARRLEEQRKLAANSGSSSRRV